MAKERGITRVNIGCIMCMGMMLMLLVLQFAPFWTYGEAGDMTASISRYVWMPTQVKELETSLQATLGSDFDVSQMVLCPIIVLVGAAAGAVLCLIKQDSIITPVVAVVTGLGGMIGYLSQPALRMGIGWGVHLALCIMILLTGALTGWWMMQKND